MSEHVLDGQPPSSDPWATRTPVDGFDNLTSTVLGHELFWRDFELWFFGTILEAIPVEYRKELLTSFLGHEKSFKEGIEQILYHKDRLAELLSVEQRRSSFERRP
jgi:hypothetical protein